MASESRSAVHDSMPDRDRRRHFRVGKEPSDANDRFPLAGNGDGLREQHMVACVLREEFTFLVADRFSRPGEQNTGPCRSDAVQSKFERGRAAVQGENSRFWFSVCHVAPGGKIELTSSSANRGPLACRHHARRHRACDVPSWSNSARSPSAPDRPAVGCAGWRQRQVGSGRGC